MGIGKVFLVGAGPGDPRLITIKGMEAIKQADAIVYDRLANPRLLSYARHDAELIYAGKLPNSHIMNQDEINRLLVELAGQGKLVTRLKGGDPCVFGRVGEEAQLLVRHGIPYEIVPGISSSIAVPAYAGIPLTHRDYNTSFTVVTGHEKPEKLDSTVDWEKLTGKSQTVIFLMGVSNIRLICERLIAHGRSKDTPVALVRWGTRPEQETLTGTLETIADLVEARGFKPPAVTIIGEVVGLRDELAWYEQLPLFGKRILVTRTREQASELASQIDVLGGEALELPVITTQVIQSETANQALHNCLSRLSSYDAAVFTSVNGVRYFFEKIKQWKIDIRGLHGAKLFAVGEKTADALADHGLFAAQPTSEQTQEGLAEIMLRELSAGDHVLFPKAEMARDVLPDALREAGMQVDDPVLYQTLIADSEMKFVMERLEQGRIHVITFTSSSTVRNLITLISQQHDHPVEILRDVKVACIGPLTAQEAEKHGLTVHYMAKQATIESLLEAIIEGESTGRQQA